MKFRSRGHGTNIILGAIIVAIASVMAVGARAADVYNSNQGHTEIRFGWDHAGVSMQHGEFTKADGTLILDPEHIENSTINVTIDTSSLSTGVTALDTHLKSSDFFDVAKYPTATFESTAVKKIEEMTADVTGNLTIHGVTKPVILKVKLTHKGSHPTGKYIESYKGSWIAFAAEIEIKHLEFGVGSYPAGLSDTIKVQISTEMKYQQK